MVNSGTIKIVIDYQAPGFSYSAAEVSSALTWLNEAKSDLTKSDDMIREALMWLSNS